jgi:hypothetical protein
LAGIQGIFNLFGLKFEHDGKVLKYMLVGHSKSKPAPILRGAICPHDWVPALNVHELTSWPSKLQDDLACITLC